jgi:hypothetical protein
MKKIIFSRKGFDSSAGGIASPIFPDFTLFSIPIPSDDREDEQNYKDLAFSYKQESIADILNDLSKKSIVKQGYTSSCNYKTQRCHHDPMHIQTEEYDGIVFGQYDRAAGHLRNKKVSEGDIFLFYGWFKEVEKNSDTWQYKQKAKDLHLIWSYMVVGEVYSIETPQQREQLLKTHPFLKEHPHMKIEKDKTTKTNTLYLSKEYKYFNYSQNRILTDTKEYKGRSNWRLPKYFNQPQAFSYLKKFHDNDNDTNVSFRGYGQEFVLDLNSVADRDTQDILSYIQQLTGNTFHESL